MNVDTAFVSGILAAWDELGVHRTGTQVDHDTAAWLAGCGRDAGADAAVMPFPFRRRVPVTARLEAGGRHADGLVTFDAPDTPASGVHAPLGWFEAGGGVEPAGIGVTPVFSAPTSEQARWLDAGRRESTCAGLVTLSGVRSGQAGLAPFNADAWPNPHGPPLLQIGAEHGSWIRAAAEQGREGWLTIASTWEDGEAANVEAVVPGSDPDAAPVVVMTPRSSWWTSTAERGGGIAVWLAVLHDVAARPARRTVRFTANTGHELGHVGLQVFDAANPGLLASAHAWMHLGANLGAAAGPLRLQAADESLRRLGRAALDAQRVAIAGEAPPGVRPVGEAQNVFDAGGRYVSLIGGNELFHHPDDRWPANVDLAAVTAIASATVAIVRALADQD